MPKVFSALLTSVLLLASPVCAADYKCSKPETSKKLNDYDIEIKQRAEAVEEIKTEAKEAGGTTEQHKQALDTFEQKLAKVKADREALLKECTSG